MLFFLHLLTFVGFSLALPVTKTVETTSGNSFYATTITGANKDVTVLIVDPSTTLKPTVTPTTDTQMVIVGIIQTSTRTITSGSSLHTIYSTDKNFNVVQVVVDPSTTLKPTGTSAAPVSETGLDNGLQFTYTITTTSGSSLRTITTRDGLGNSVIEVVVPSTTLKATGTATAPVSETGINGFKFTYTITTTSGSSLRTITTGDGIGNTLIEVVVPTTTGQASVSPSLDLSPTRGSTDTRIVTIGNSFPATNNPTSTTAKSSGSSSSKTTSTSSSKSATVAVAASTPLSSANIAILQLALFLEYLEGTLYTKGFNQFSEQQYEMEGFARPFRTNVGVIAQQEGIHAATIKSILVGAGVDPVPNCTFSFNFTNVKDFVALGNMVSTAGVGAYLAGGAALTDNLNLLSAASSILTVEARHDAYLRGVIGASPYPSSFDTVLPAPLAYNLAQAFVVSCPRKLNYPTYPALTVTSPIPKSNLPALKAGTNITFAYNPSSISNFSSYTQLNIALLNSVTNVTYVPASSCGTGCAYIALPAGLSNIAFAVMTNLFGADLTTLTASGVLAGPAEVLIS